MPDNTALVLLLFAVLMVVNWARKDSGRLKSEVKSGGKQEDRGVAR